MDGYKSLCEWLRIGAGRLNGLRSQCVMLGMRCWCSSNKAEGLKFTRIPLLGAESTVRVHVNAYGHSIQVKPKVKQFRKVFEQPKVKVLGQPKVKHWKVLG